MPRLLLQKEMSLSIEAGHLLPGVARGAILKELGVADVTSEATLRQAASLFREPGASFVTLRKYGELRGCIGNIRATRPLYEDVQHNAVAAAMRDLRFLPLETAEAAEISIEVSVLSPLQPLQFSDETDVLAQLLPYEDGIVLEYGYLRSTFLPKVWESLPSPQDFLVGLKQKAGLPANFWSKDIRLWRYHATCWSEADKIH